MAVFLQTFSSTLEKSKCSYALSDMLYFYHLGLPRIFGTLNQTCGTLLTRLGLSQENWNTHTWDPYIHSVLSFACLLLTTYLAYVVLSLRVILPFLCVYFSGDPGRDYRELELCSKCSSGDCKKG
jgi:hypothetical protein